MEKIIRKIKDNSIFFTLGDNIIFNDTVDHWENGILRLLGKNDQEISDWIFLCNDIAKKKFKKNLHEISSEKKAEILQITWQNLFFKDNQREKINLTDAGKNKKCHCGKNANIIWQEGFNNDPSYSVIGCKECQHGWLHYSDHERDKNTEYEKEYFEGEKKGLGYGNYAKQTPWRIEKAQRLIQWIEKACSLINLPIKSRPYLLDVGSGYGFFRFAAEKKGWRHEGIEISKYAANQCFEQYHFQTFVGSLSEYSHNEKFDIITLWDVIEHVEKPIQYLEHIKKLLNPGGICVIRTPNLFSIEHKILGSDYYSLKKEHLHYFSPYSLNKFFEKAGLRTRFLKTDSHIFSGFFEGNMNFFEVILQGSDIFALAINNNH